MSETSFTTVGGKLTIDKDPNAHLDYTLRVAAWLAAAGNDSIATVSVREAVGVTVASIAFVGPNVTVWVQGGTVGQPASVTVTITTIGGRVDDRTLHFKIRQR